MLVDSSASACPLSTQFAERIRAVVDSMPSFDERPGITARLAAIIATIPDVEGVAA